MYGRCCFNLAYLPHIDYLLNDLAVANLNIEPAVLIFTYPWEARSGCPPHHRVVVERMIIGVLVQDPLCPDDKFQESPSVTLAIKSPEDSPQVLPVRSPIKVDFVTFRLFPEDPYAPLGSTAPLKLTGSEGRQKRKRALTRGRYKDAIAKE